MKRLAGISAVFVGLIITGCSVGNDPAGGGSGSGSGSGSDTGGRMCTAQMTASGSFAPNTATPPPTDWTGCWPAGTWTFKMAVTTTDCSPAPTPLAQYVFTGEQDLDMNGDPVVDKFTYVTDPSVRNIVKVSQEGNGLCEAEVDLYSADGKTVWTLKPVLQADNTLTGDGEYAVFDTDQWPY